MRVIAGSARRIQLRVAPGSSTRPFLEMARGALFNSLAARVDGARVLDLYAGSGALGIEALSRGAAHCTFVEYDRNAAQVLRQNLETCGVSDRAAVLNHRVEGALAGMRGAFDLILLDPPFALNPGWEKDAVASQVMRDCARLLAEGGRLVFRFEEAKAAPPDWPGLVLRQDRRYGRSRVCYYVLPGDAAGGESGPDQLTPVNDGQGNP